MILTIIVQEKKFPQTKNQCLYLAAVTISKNYKPLKQDINTKLKFKMRTFRPSNSKHKSEKCKIFS